jgi:superfamily II DNA or RNA helicase
LTLPSWPVDRPLRAWQQAAAAAVLSHEGDAFLASATPAAGKTTFGLHIAHRLLSEGRVARVAVVAPTTHIARQWAADAARYGIDLEPNRPNADGPEPSDRHGVSVTYQTVAAGPSVHGRRADRVPTLLLADEPHHMGDQASWGVAVTSAFANARFRLLLSGTPFRTDDSQIPWVSYDADGVSEPDHAYGYTQALLDGVCRPVTFHTYDGDMEWMSDGRRRSADFGVVLPAAESARRLRTALDPDGDWMRHVLRDAVERLDAIRAGDHPEAGGLVVAMDKEHAEALADRLAPLIGHRPEVVTSDAPDAGARIDAFAAGHGTWLVSVLMVSEGVDVPRLRVGVYATSARTELFFRQVVGRFVRRTPTPREQMSHLFLPADPVLRRLAAQVEEERRHAISLERTEADPLAEPVVREQSEPGEAFRVLSATAHGTADLLRTTAPGEPLQLFGDPTPAPAPSPALAAFTASSNTTTTSPARPAPSARLDARVPAVATAATAAPSRPAGETAHERRVRLREERKHLVAARARVTGEPHRVIHARINRATGAASVTAATVAQLEKGNALLEKESSRG